jgi:predicted RNA-binding protein Jag
MNSEIQSSIIDFIKIVTNAIDNKLEITFEKEADQWRVVLNSEKVEYLLGNRGENLKSLQHLVRVLFHIDELEKLKSESIYQRLLIKKF